MTTLARAKCRVISKEGAFCTVRCNMVHFTVHCTVHYYNNMVHFTVRCTYGEFYCAFYCALYGALFGAFYCAFVRVLYYGEFYCALYGALYHALYYGAL